MTNHLSLTELCNDANRSVAVSIRSCDVNLKSIDPRIFYSVPKVFVHNRAKSFKKPTEKRWKKIVYERLSCVESSGVGQCWAAVTSPSCFTMICVFFAVSLLRPNEQT